jgi:hypothetical protein
MQMMKGNVLAFALWGMAAVIQLRLRICRVWWAVCPSRLGFALARMLARHTCQPGTCSSSPGFALDAPMQFKEYDV